MTDNTYRPSFISSYGRNPLVFADDRLLAQVGAPSSSRSSLSPSRCRRRRLPAGRKPWRLT